MEERIKALEVEVAALTADIRRLRSLKSDATLTEMASSVTSLIGLPHMKQRRALKGSRGYVYAVAWFPDDLHLASVSRDNTLLIWDSLTSAIVHRIPLMTSDNCAIAVSPSGRFVAKGGLDNCITVFDVPIIVGGGDQRATSGEMLQGHNGWLSGCKFVLDDNFMVSSSGDMTCAYWDVKEAKLVHSFEGHEGEVLSVAVLPKDPNVFISTSCDRLVKIWDIRSKRSVQSLAGHNGDVHNVAIMANSLAFATSSDDGCSLLFDLRSSSSLHRFSKSNFQNIPYVEISCSGRILFTAHEEGSIVAWDALRGEELYEVEQAHEKRVSSLSMSGDGEKLCSSSWDGLIKIWC